MATNEETNAAGTDTRPRPCCKSDYSLGRFVYTGRSMTLSQDEKTSSKMADTQAEIIPSQVFPRHIFQHTQSDKHCKGELGYDVEMPYARIRLLTLEIPYTSDEHKICQQIFQPNGIYTHLKAYEPHAKKTLKKQEQSTSIVDPLAYVAHTTSAPAHSTPTTPNLNHTAQFPPTNNHSGPSSNSRTHATEQDGHIALTTTNMFQANYEDAYDSDVDEGPNTAVAFMANLSSTRDAPWRTLDSDAETELIENTYPCDTTSIFLDIEAQNVPTEYPADTTDKVPVTSLGYMAKRAQPALYDADTLLHPTHHPVSIWDSEEVLVHQVVSMKKMNEKPGHVRPANGFYVQHESLKFVPSQERSLNRRIGFLPMNVLVKQVTQSSHVPPFMYHKRKNNNKTELCFLNGVLIMQKQFVEQQGRIPLTYCYTEKLSALTADNTRAESPSDCFTSLLAYKSLFNEVMVMAYRRFESSEFRDLNELAPEKSVRGYPAEICQRPFVPSCLLVKVRNIHPLKTENTNTEVLNTLHMDLCGPMRTESINGKKYILVIVDDYTRFGWVRFLRSKDETPQVIEKFIVKTQRALYCNCLLRHEQINGTYLLNKTLERMVLRVLYFPRNERTYGLHYRNGRCRKTEPNSYGSCSYYAASLRKHHCSLWAEAVDDLFQWFDDDEVVPIPPVVPITPVNVPAAPAPENANGSPSTTVISEGAPAVTENLLPHQYLYLNTSGI
ncbi:retrovirus-related pol polyprotein from transposon TNT 1-94 [Tanacetum coccineum]